VKELAEVFITVVWVLADGVNESPIFVIEETESVTASRPIFAFEILVGLVVLVAELEGAVHAELADFLLCLEFNLSLVGWSCGS
jgi:hypothetical protein